MSDGLQFDKAEPAQPAESLLCAGCRKPLVDSFYLAGPQKICAGSAKEIRALIETSGQTVARGSELAGQAESSMQQVVAAVKRMTEVIGEIESAGREQSAGIEQINKAMAEMDRMTQSDAQMAEELIATAETLQDQSRQMLAAISSFSMQGAHAAAAEAPAARRHYAQSVRRAA